MGIFDSLTNLSPEQNQGLLAAAAQILQQSGPSRTPTSFGQILGGGLGAYQQSIDAQKKRKMEEDQAAQIAQLTGLKIADAKSDLANQTAARDRAEQLRQFYMKQGSGGIQNAIQTPPEMGNNLAPTQSNSDLLNSLQPSPMQNSGAQNGGIYQQRLAMAQQLRNAGFSAEADAQEAAALKFQPKVKEWQKVQREGKVLYAPYFEDGTSGSPVPLEVAEKLEKINTGGATELANPYTGATVRSLKNTQSPDSVAQVAATIRGQNISRQNALDTLLAPTFNQEAGGFISRPTAAAPNGTLTPLAGLPTRGPKLTEDQGKATGWLVQAENAFANMKAATAANPSAAKPGINDIIGAIPGVSGGANLMRGEERQKFLQGSSSLGEALLRAATGAGVNKDEALQKQRELTPQIGDSNAVIKQKMDSIPLYIESLKVRAGAGAPLAADVLSNKPGKGAWGIEKVN